ncbi:hypothetical protein SAMN04488126_101308 [Bhargavaea beijingensis]|uniref:Uncharacterized protein n=1 Tax=Bhargavaea beijingensis TaxID=426756 RepID=A0A1G6Y714_9BACL|nr:hypothetical protein [Bhargavaea beijingensis]SDD85385.1 hypothetical protein SAMN04488126_101308 [Bhargavaea beijingensis]
MIITVRQWKITFELLFYLSVIIAIVSVFERTSEIEALIVLIAIGIIRVIFNMTIGKDLETVFDHKAFKFLDTVLTAALLVGVYWNSRDVGILISTGITAILSLFAFIFSLLKRNNPDAEDTF